MFDPNDFEIFRRPEYVPFYNKGRCFKLHKYPYLDIVFNDHCNAQCKFCISHLIHKKVKADIQKHKPKIKYAIEKLGVREVLLLGGEPTINNDIFRVIDYLKDFPLNKICITTNGHRIAKSTEYAERLVSSGITHMNLSLMSLDEEKQRWISGSKVFFSIDNLQTLYGLCRKHSVRLRINNNVFIGNNATPLSALAFYGAVSGFCDSVKFSPLLKTDSFSVVNEVNDFNREYILTDDEYDDLWHRIEDCFSSYPIVRNKQTFGFVEYSMIVLPVPIILNYNQHGQLRKKVIENKQINNLKLLPTSDLSLSWNREEAEFFIETE